MKKLILCGVAVAGLMFLARPAEAQVSWGISVGSGFHQPWGPVYGPGCRFNRGFHPGFHSGFHPGFNRGFHPGFHRGPVYRSPYYNPHIYRGPRRW